MYKETSFIHDSQAIYLHDTLKHERLIEIVHQVSYGTQSLDHVRKLRMEWPSKKSDLNRPTTEIFNRWLIHKGPQRMKHSDWPNGEETLKSTEK